MNQPYVAVPASPSEVVFLAGNKVQVMPCRNAWKDLLSSVSLFALLVLQLLDDCSCEIWWSYTRQPRQTNGERSWANVVISGSNPTGLSDAVAQEFKDLWLNCGTRRILMVEILIFDKLKHFLTYSKCNCMASLSCLLWISCTTMGWNFYLQCFPW